MVRARKEIESRNRSRLAEKLSSFLSTLDTLDGYIRALEQADSADPIG